MNVLCMYTLHSVSYTSHFPAAKDCVHQRMHAMLSMRTLLQGMIESPLHCSCWPCVCVYTYLNYASFVKDTGCLFEGEVIGTREPPNNEGLPNLMESC